MIKCISYQNSGGRSTSFQASENESHSETKNNYSKSYHISCPQCGSSQQKLGAGKAPGQASLLCGECGKFIKWVNAREVQASAREQGEARS